LKTEILFSSEAEDFCQNFGCLLPCPATDAN